MVLEKYFKADAVEHRPHIAFFFGFVFTVISFFISYILFRQFMSLAIVFMATLLLTPTLVMLLKHEERIERRFGIKHFFRNHKAIYEAYIFAFLGVFLAFVFLGLAYHDKPHMYGQLFDFQTRFLSFQQGLSVEGVQDFVAGNVQFGSGQFWGMLANDMIVLVLCFVLSFVYGATAIFLIILNGSVFANFIVFVIRTLSTSFVQGLQAFVFFLIHMIPEVSGFLIAAIAGGVVSKAVLTEKKGSKAFRNVFKDATILMLIAIGLVVLSVLLEVFVTAKLFQTFF
ncbi:stage II sporulation protein M [Nanoarchaeota archaeon]